MKVLVLKQHSPHAPKLAHLLGPGFEVQGSDALPPDSDAQVLVTTHLTAEQAAASHARLVHVPGAGFDGVAWDSLPRGCLGANVFCHEIPIAEYVLFMALGHVLRPHAPARLDESTWPGAYMYRPLRGELHGSRMTIIGTGHIGQEIARRARGFGIATLGVNRSGRAAPDFDQTVPVSRLDEYLPRTDILVLCCPLDDSTRGLIDRRRLAMLPPTGLLINVARGEVVDEAGLYDTLRDRKIAGAVLDVWYRYPKTEADRMAPANYPFDQLDNVLMTPHISGWSQGLIDRRYQVIADNIKRLAQGQPLVNQIWPR